MKDLKAFIIKANKNGYASGNTGVKEDDGSTTIIYKQGEWKEHDNFFGGEPYGGREVVFKNGKAYWIMVYYGSVIKGEDLGIVYSFLQKALIKPGELPVRGPREFIEGDFRYLNEWSGNLYNFDGTERILRGKTEIYIARYVGGFVDQVKE